MRQHDDVPKFTRLRNSPRVVSAKVYDVLRLRHGHQLEDAAPKFERAGHGLEKISRRKVPFVRPERKPIFIMI